MPDFISTAYVAVRDAACDLMDIFADAGLGGWLAFTGTLLLGVLLGWNMRAGVKQGDDKRSGGRDEK